MTDNTYFDAEIEAMLRESAPGEYRRIGGRAVEHGLATLDEDIFVWGDVFAAEMIRRYGTDKLFDVLRDPRPDDLDDGLDEWIDELEEARDAEGAGPHLPKAARHLDEIERVTLPCMARIAELAVTLGLATRGEADAIAFDERFQEMLSLSGVEQLRDLPAEQGTDLERFLRQRAYEVALSA